MFERKEEAVVTGMSEKERRHQRGRQGHTKQLSQATVGV